MKHVIFTFLLIFVFPMQSLLAQSDSCVHQKEDLDNATPVQEAELVCEKQPRSGLWLSWEGMNTEVCKPSVPAAKLAKAVKDAACRCNTKNPRVLVYGDLVFMRRQEELVSLGPDFSRRLAAAYMSQDLNVAKRILATDLSGQSLQNRAFADLLLAQVAMRAALTSASGLLAKAEQSADAAGTPQADIHYLGAVNSLDAGRIDEARIKVNKALHLEPTFFNARLLSLFVALREWARSSTGACPARLESIFDNLSGLLTLSPCPIHAAYIDAGLVAQPSIRRDSAPVSLVRLALASVAKAPQAQVEQEAILSASVKEKDLPSECALIVERELTALKNIR